MGKTPVPTRHHNSRKLLILLPLIYLRTLHYETPCIKNGEHMLNYPVLFWEFRNVKKKGKQIRLSQAGIWTLGFRTICVLSKPYFSLIDKRKNDHDTELLKYVYEKAVWIVQNLNFKFNHVVCGTAVAGRTLRDAK